MIVCNLQLVFLPLFCTLYKSTVMDSVRQDRAKMKEMLERLRQMSQQQGDNFAMTHLTAKKLMEYERRGEKTPDSFDFM